MNTLVWLRSDLRLHDNQALSAAATQGLTRAVFLASPGQWQTHGDAAVKVDFWRRNLLVLGSSLAQLGIELSVLTLKDWSQAPQALAVFCAARAIEQVHINAEWGINERRRDQACTDRLARDGVSLSTHHCGTLLPPGTVRTGKGDPYRVFTPYARACRDILRSAPPAAQRAPRPQGPVSSPPSLPDIWPDVDAGIAARWPAGEDAAHARLRDFLDQDLMRYHERRDLPALPGTSALSPYLASGVLSPAQCLRAALRANQGEIDSGQQGARAWITELLWREFYLHLLAAYPALSMHQPMRPETRYLAWRRAPEDLRAWQEGRTGIPLVDAAQRQLLATGWMHNRLRMVSAMFLAKNLLLDWRLGEAWFMGHLIDGDLAANNGGWQWSASTGADAVPYFRVFNPITQSRRFDPKAAFLRHWLPELAGLDDKSIHEPSDAQRRATGYPQAIADLKTSRLRAIEAFSSLPAAGT
ncbi:cryptochrome/photolyase family protein [Bordetella holmesii]|uniref:FAD binding domain of DNA photolyase n=2 Tax=Bordetella holmesii TaxID=35814 RepID=A0A158M2X3_9BORD|nr:FAD-binding domain-containing protein [Bordetella holmesii]AHV92827.1 FAD binding domain of DNA photolyase family protein [Bordetella holmesii ATCC 51541]AIT28049.1 FAD binding domain of DNA photolyase family protein [Bordetella holmesii 44057]EWM41916.1 FAD binding domain of DNA photolyase family protein [Bordetella holmesii 41130]EWM44727.1 FAD binding domain of DNA photolyase family protein [Bordetella holmesii 70147]AMD46768.1 deoxyribodipyrimidine photolyase [Bordetella holmesii H558]